MAFALCTGCGIGGCIDADRLVKMVDEENPGITCIQHEVLCAEEGLARLKKAVNEKQINRLAVAACSPRAKSGQFTISGVYTERINLREQVAWVMEPGNQDTMMCAEDQIRMALAKLNSIRDN